MGGGGSAEEGCIKGSGKVVVEVDPRYYRPTEVELLIGDATKARKLLGWVPKTTFGDLVKVMAKADLEEGQEKEGIEAHNDAILKNNG